MKQVVFSIVIAAALWFVMFSPWTAPHLPFWIAMAVSACLLTALAWLFGGSRHLHMKWQEVPTTVLLGVGIAVVLWGVFWMGDKLSQWLFDFARPQVDTIYAMKTGSAPWVIGLLLLFVIGPAEELFWRGYVQRTLAQRLTLSYKRIPRARATQRARNWAFILTTAAYTLVHLPSMNFMLIMSALVCGLLWGGLYRLFPHRLPAIILSHALWDAAVFVWFPIL